MKQELKKYLEEGDLTEILDTFRHLNRKDGIFICWHYCNTTLTSAYKGYGKVYKSLKAFKDRIRNSMDSFIQSGNDELEYFASHDEEENKKIY